MGRALLPSFMDNLERQVQPIKNQGAFFGAIDGDRKLPAVATRDIATVVARLLIDATWSGRQEVPVLGPEDLSFNDMARIMSEVLNKPVRYVHHLSPMVRGRIEAAHARLSREQYIAPDPVLGRGQRHEGHSVRRSRAARAHARARCPAPPRPVATGAGDAGRIS